MIRKQDILIEALRYKGISILSLLYVGVLLNYIITSMEKSLQGKEEPVLHLYSGHDLTIVHVLRVLNLVDTIKPSFGASVAFELYSDGQVKVNFELFVAIFVINK